MEPHFVDALGATEGLEARGRWADLGSGAGFPGIALAARYPEAHVELVESREKRARFLTRVVRAGAIDNATVHRVRSETLEVHAYDGLISRAYKPPPRVLSEDAARLLKPGGRVVLLLGDGASVDLPPGFCDPKRTRYPVPDGHRVQLTLTWAGVEG
jgi:16S rRNA (guanine527-N7)-methyltransferase